MKGPGLLGRLDDLLNPIVVKELRQAVRSRLVTAVLLLFLTAQLTYLGIHLIVDQVAGRLTSVDFQAGRTSFLVLQGILLGTCMLFLPLYTGVRLGAERSDVNVDLLFITTLQPRAIVTGKLAATLVLALMIFSACAPFLAFTYFLRGIDLTSIYVVLGLDFAAVVLAVQLGIFLAVIPTNRFLKALLGLAGLGALAIGFGMTLASSVVLVEEGMAHLMEDRQFWAVVTGLALGVVAFMGLLFTWSVALLQPPSSNRALPMRVFLLLLCPLAGAVLGYFDRALERPFSEGPFLAWFIAVAVLATLALVIAVNEREQWGPRVRRAIPKRWWLRGPAFLLSSGSAGGVLFALLLFGLAALALQVWRQAFPHLPPADGRGSFWAEVDFRQVLFETMAGLGLYAYCYALTAALVRRVFLPRVPTGYTWVVFLALLVAGSVLPFLGAFLVLYGEWRYQTHFFWLLPNPAAAVGEFADPRASLRAGVYWLFVGGWAGLITLASVPWFGRQWLRFRPLAAKPTDRPPSVPLLDGTRTALEETRTAP
jgi:hypothetical protein